MTNLDFFLSNPLFASFAEVAVSAEKIPPMELFLSIILCI